MMAISKAYAAQSADGLLEPYAITRRELQATDVQLRIQYCGICHSDLHAARNDWGNTVFPIVPGHEIVGTVMAVGAQVGGFRVGQVVGVGCIVDSCRQCDCCEAGLEQYCEQGFTATYNSPDKISGGMTYGGYSEQIVVDEKYLLNIPDKLDPAAAAPLLCAGITTYSPLRHWKVEAGQTVGVVGLGGLGHIAIKLAAAMGATVVLYTTSADKAEDARRLGASDVVISRDRDDMRRYTGRLDFILNTVAAPHDLDRLLGQLAVDGTMVLIGAPSEPHPSPRVFQLLTKRRSLAGSFIGGIAETQEMLDFCATNDIAADIEMIAMDQINEAYERMLAGDVKYRFVIDMARSV